MKKPIKIGEFEFRSKDDALEHCREVLHRKKLDTEVTGDDARFVAALLNARPEKAAELRGRRVVRYLRKMHRHNTPCFFAELEDGTLLDISFMKLLSSAQPRPAAA